MLKDEIDIWIRNEKLKFVFPREVGIYRRKTNTIYELFRSDVVYSAIFSEWQKDNLCYDTIFIDVDEHDENLSFEERMCILDEKKEIILRKFERCGIELRWYFTGNGYHAYCDFAPMRFRSKYVYKETVKKFINEVLGDDIDLIDLKVVGDVRRVSRLPGKRHKKTKLYSIRIDGDWDWEKCVSESVDMRFFDGKCVCNEWLNDYLNDLSKQIKDVSLDNIKMTNDFLKEISMNPKCVEVCLMSLASTGELVHEGRLFMTSWLLACGLSVDEIVNIYKLYANDFNERKTREQIYSIFKVKGYFYSCKNLKRLGICPYDDFKKCAFYVLSDGWLKRLVSDEDMRVVEKLQN